MSESLVVASATPEAQFGTIEGGGAKASPPSIAIRHRRGLSGSDIATITGLSAPAIIVFVLFVIVPVIVALYYSFFAWKGFGAPRYIGIKNYADTLQFPELGQWFVSLFSGGAHAPLPEFWAAVGHNGIIMVLSLVMQGPLAILVALLMNQKMRGRSLIRVLIFVPYVISEAIVGTGLHLMLQDAGAVNALFHSNIGWLSNPKIAMWTLMFILTWKYLGFAIILMLAGLQGIPEELSEAGAVDGASYWQIQWHIMLPLLKPTIKIWAFLSIIGSMQLFDLVFVIWGQYIASIAGVSTMAWYMAANGRLSGQLGLGSAIAIVVFFISLIVALLYQRYVLNRDTDGALTEAGDK